MYDPCFPQNETFTKAEQKELHKAKFMAKEREQFMVHTPQGAYIASICQPKASFNLSFTAQVINLVKDLSQSINKLQSSAVAREKEHPSQEVYTTSFTDCRYHMQYPQPPPRPYNRPPNRYTRIQSSYKPPNG